MIGDLTLKVREDRERGRGPEADFLTGKKRLRVSNMAAIARPCARSRTESFADERNPP